MLLDGVMGSLCGSPATRARPSSCAFVRRHVQTPVFGRIRPKSRRRCGVLHAGPDLMAFSAARNARARLVPKNRRGRVATGAAFMEMRRINDIFRFGSERASAIIGTRARQAAGGSLPSARRSVSYLSAGRSQLFRPRRTSSPVFWLPWRAPGTLPQGAPRGTPLRRKTPPPPRGRRDRSKE